MIKPDPRIFELLLTRDTLVPHQTVFIDDDRKNAAAAHALGIHGIHFRSAETLRLELAALDLL